MTSSMLWLTGIVTLPFVVIAASFTRLHVERLRRLAVATASVLGGLAALAMFVPGVRELSWSSAAGQHPLLGAEVLRVDILSSLLVPLTAGLWLVTVAATPRARLDRKGLRRTALATLFTMLSFLTDSPALLAIFWVLSVWIFCVALSAPEHRHSRNVALLYLGASALLFVVGVLLVFAVDVPGGACERVGLWLVVGAVLIRKGIFPFHAWVPEVFEGGRLGPAVLFGAPQLGAYVALVLLVPRAPQPMLELVSILAFVTVTYGAALALVQRSARRCCGYLFVSQSALVLAGFSCLSVESLAGGLVLWVSSALGFTGLARCVLVLEARRGRLDLTRYHGGYEQMPLLATSFLVMGLACTGFPGTLGFIGEEMLIGGIIEDYPILGFSVVVAGALTGLATLRMYFSLFCGRREVGMHQQLLRREALAFAGVALVLLGTGLVPASMVASRWRAGEDILQSRPVTAVSHAAR